MPSTLYIHICVFSSDTNSNQVLSSSTIKHFITLISLHFDSYLPFSIMKTGNRFVGIANAKHKLQRTLSQRIKMASAVADVPKGHLAVYVGENHKRFVIPISYLSHPLFRDLLDWAEEEFGFNHPMGGLTIPCTEHYFITLTSSLN